MRTTEELERAFGQQVRHSRLLRDWDQQTMAAHANVSVGAVRNLEQGRGSSLRTITRITRALGKDDWLMSFQYPETVSPLQVLRDTGRMTRPRQRAYRRRGSAND